MFSVPPWKAFARKWPPGLSTEIAKSAATSARCMVRMWSVRRCPVVGAAMSDSTTSGSPPSASISLAGRGVVEEIHLQDGRARHRVHAEIVDADDARMLLAAT